MKRRLIYTLALSFLIGITSQVFSNEAKTSQTLHHITELNGLPSYSVYKIFKDSHGMIWFGTFNGICRFDGRTITPFQIDIPQFSNTVTDITETPSGKILFGTRSGLYIADAYRQKCIHVCPEIGFVNGLEKIGKTVLVASQNGLWIFDSQNQTAEAVKISHSVISKGNTINDIANDGQNGVWLCGNERLIHLNLQDRSLRTFEITKELVTGNLRNICRIGDKLYIGTHNSGLLQFDTTTQTAKKYTTVGPVICDLHSDGEKLLYVATDGDGAHIIDTRSGQVARTFRTNSPDYPLPSNALYTFWYDSDLNIYWFGFTQDGVCYNYHHSSSFHIYRYKNLDTNGLPVRSFCIQGDNMVVGTREGLYFVSEKRDIVRYFPPQETGGQIITNIRFFGNHFVIATFEKGLSILDPETLKLTHLNQNEALEHGNFSRLVPSRDDKLFACSNMGLFVLDTTFHVVQHFHSKNSELPDAYICDFLFDLTGKGWIGTSDRLALYDPLTQAIQSRDFPEDFFNNEPNLTFNLCRNGDMLVVSEYAAYRSKSDLSGFTKLNLYERTKAGNIFFIKENRKGQYWVGTDKGLFLFEKDLKEFKQFNENNNLPSLKFNRNEFQETPDGTFWFANTKGLVYLPLKEQANLSRKIRSRIILDEIHIDNLPARPAAYQTQMERKEIHLTWNFRSQSLSVVPLLLNYEKPQGRYYEWALDGGDYRSCTDGEAIRFESLPAGNHELKIRLAGHEETASVFTISVGPSVAYYLEAFLLFLLTFFAWYAVTIKNKRAKLKEAIRKKHLLDMEIAAQRAIRMQKEMEAERKKKEEEARLQTLYQKSKMNQSEHKAIYKKVKECMEQQKPYTNPELRLSDLAEMVGCTTNKLSQMFSLHLQQNFFDFINLYRVEEFKRRATNEKYSQYTTTAISEACGFKRSTFFATFKKFEHCTPSEFLQKKCAKHAPPQKPATD